jgi:hypothetical protein
MNILKIIALKRTVRNFKKIIIAADIESLRHPPIETLFSFQFQFKKLLQIQTKRLVAFIVDNFCI